MIKNSSLPSILACLLMACACAEKQMPPVQQAVADKMMENHPGLSGIKLYNFEVKDSVTLSQELDRREKLLQTKFKAENREFQKYSLAGKKNNAELHKQRGLATRESLKKIKEYREMPGFKPDSVIYYIASFLCEGKIDGSRQTTGVMEAAIGTDLKVYNIQPEGGNINTGMGAAIPGYREWIIGDEESEE